MWLEIGNSWHNLDQIVRVDFVVPSQPHQQLTATMFSVKPGGSDRHILVGDEAKKLKETLENIHCGTKCKTSKTKA
jgi:hypothetical protein